MHPVGFEPTPPKRTELESVALDHSATDAVLVQLICYYLFKHDWRSWQRVGLIILRSWVRSPHCAQEKYARFSLALLAQQVALWSYVPTVQGSIP